MTALQKVIKYLAVALAMFLIVSIIGGVFGIISMFGLLSDDSAVGEMQTYTIENPVERLEIDISAAALTIEAGDGYSVKSNHKYLSVKEKNGILEIKETKTRFNISSNELSVVLTVPEEVVWEEAEVSAGAGKVSIETLSAYRLELELGAGETDITCLNVLSEGKIDSGVGKLTIHNGEMQNVKLEMGVGKVELTGRLTGRCSMDCGVGDTEIVLLGKEEDYRIQVDTGIGDAKWNGRTLKDGDVIGDGVNRIDIDGGIGAINIRNEEK